MDGHFSDLLRLLKNGQKYDSFSAHFEQHFNYTTSRTQLAQWKHLLNQIANYVWRNA